MINSVFSKSTPNRGAYLTYAKTAQTSKKRNAIVFKILNAQNVSAEMIFLTLKAITSRIQDNGSIPKDSKIPQSFFNSKMKISDIEEAIRQILLQNRDEIIKKGTKYSYQIRGKYNGINYVLGFNKGNIGQFYPE